MNTLPCIVKKIPINSFINITNPDTKRSILLLQHLHLSNIDFCDLVTGLKALLKVRTHFLFLKPSKVIPLILP